MSPAPETVPPPRPLARRPGRHARHRPNGERARRHHRHRSQQHHRDHIEAAGPTLGCQKPARHLNCGNAPESAGAHDAQPFCGVQEHRAVRAPRPDRCAAPHQAPTPARLGGPSDPHRVDPAPAQKAAGAPAGHPRYRPSVAPPPRHQEVGQSAPHRTTAGQRRDHHANRAPRHRESSLGIPADPRGTAQARPPGQRVHDPPNPQSTEGPPGAQAAHRHDVAAVPARPRPRRCSPPTASPRTAR